MPWLNNEKIPVLTLDGDTEFINSLPDNLVTNY